MKRSGHQPRLLSAVMEAIANLKEGKGSTQKKIIEQVQNHLSTKNVTFRNVMVQIRKAIKHGVESGLIKQKGGKFKLGLDNKDYVVFKNFQRMDKGDMPVKEHRRRRGRRRRRRRSRRRRRRRDSHEADSAEGHESESGTVSDKDAEPTDRGRRGRRRRRRRRRRGRRRTEERDSTDSPRSAGNKEVTPKTSEEQAKNQKNAKDERKGKGYEDEEANEDAGCGNPECLCNIKQEMDDPYRLSRDDFGDDYDH